MPEGVRVITPPGEVNVNDVLVYLLRKGFRKAIKRECVPAADREAVISGYEKSGLVALVDPNPVRVDLFGKPIPASELGNFRTLIIGADAALAREALDLQIAESVEDAARESITRKLGRMLGYPDCCLDFFASVEDRSDTCGITRKMLFETRGVMNPLLNIVNGVPLIEHFSCSFNCKASAKIARAALRGIGEIYGRDTAEAVASHNSRRFIFFDPDNAIFLDGAQDGDMFRYSEVTRKGGPDDIYETLSRGNSCRFGTDGITVYKDGKMLFEGAFGGFFFNWGERSLYHDFATKPAPLEFVGRINRILHPILGDGVNGWYASSIEMVENHIFVVFENPVTVGVYKFMLKKRNDTENCAYRTTNFNVIFPRDAGSRQDADTLKRVFKLLIVGRDEKKIPRKEWTELAAALANGPLVWKQGKFIPLQSSEPR